MLGVLELSINGSAFRFSEANRIWLGHFVTAKLVTEHHRQAHPSGRTGTANAHDVGRRQGNIVVGCERPISFVPWQPRVVTLLQGLSCGMRIIYDVVQAAGVIDWLVS